MKLRPCSCAWIALRYSPQTCFAGVAQSISQSNNFRRAQFFARVFSALFGFALMLAPLCSLQACAVSAGKDPMKSLSNPESLPVVQVAAMEKLDEAPTPEYIAALKRMMWQPGFAESSRLAAFDRLVKLDEPGLKEIIRLQLPKLMAFAWRQKLC